MKVYSETRKMSNGQTLNVRYLLDDAELEEMEKCGWLVGGQSPDFAEVVYSENVSNAELDSLFLSTISVGLMQ